MMKPEDDIYIDAKTSCSREEAIAKMLGWLQATRRRPVTKITLQGIAADQLPNMHTLEGSTVLGLLQELRDAARDAYLVAARSGDAKKALQVRKDAVVHCDSRIDLAQSYFIDFDDEAANGKNSAFKIDKRATSSSGTTHYTLKTVDAWTRGRYGISVVDFRKSKPIESKTDDVDVNASEVANGLKKTVANNLYVTFALLIEDFANAHAGKYLRPNGHPNVSNLVRYIEELAKVAGGSAKLPGQSPRTLQTHIHRAIAVKRDALK